MIVCHCMQVSSAVIEATVAAGAKSVDDVTDACQAGGGCGGCCSTIENLLASMVGGMEAVPVSVAA